MQNASNIKQAVPFFMVKDINASLDFYVKMLSFEMTNSWIDEGKLRWCWLTIGSAALMLQEYAPTDQRPAGLPGGGICVYFICEDALAVYLQALGRGASPEEPIVGNQMWVVGLKDPDGYDIYFESPTDLPEEMTYKEWMATR